MLNWDAVVAVRAQAVSHLSGVLLSALFLLGSAKVLKPLSSPCAQEGQPNQPVCMGGSLQFENTWNDSAQNLLGHML